MSLDKKNSINNILEEKRIFPPSKKFAENSNISSQEELLSLKKQASDNPIQFWESFAKSELDWFEPFQTVLDNENAPFFKWFKDGELNLSYNCLDRHLETDSDRVAFYWEGEPGDTQKITYQDLYERVCKLSNALKQLGVQKGDRVAIYLGMTPEIVVSMLACARIGAIHSVVFGGFASNELASRIDDSKAKILVTASCGFEPGKTVEYRPLVDGALKLAKHKLTFINKVIK